MKTAVKKEIEAPTLEELTLLEEEDTNMTAMKYSKFK